MRPAPLRPAAAAVAAPAQPQRYLTNDEAENAQGGIVACSALKRIYRDRIRQQAGPVVFLFLDYVKRYKTTSYKCHLYGGIIFALTVIDKSSLRSTLWTTCYISR